MAMANLSIKTAHLKESLEMAIKPSKKLTKKMLPIKVRKILTSAKPQKSDRMTITISIFTKDHRPQLSNKRINTSKHPHDSFTKKTNHSTISKPNKTKPIVAIQIKVTIKTSKTLPNRKDTRVR